MPAYPWAAWGLIRLHDVVWLHTPMLETALMARPHAAGGQAVHRHASWGPDPAAGLFNRFRALVYVSELRVHGAACGAADCI
jgi:hypothetical protein